MERRPSKDGDEETRIPRWAVATLLCGLLALPLEAAYVGIDVYGSGKFETRCTSSFWALLFTFLIKEKEGWLVA